MKSYTNRNDRNPAGCCSFRGTQEKENEKKEHKPNTIKLSSIRVRYKLDENMLSRCNYVDQAHAHFG